MASLDAGVKYRGFSLEAEYYWRWLSDFEGTDTRRDRRHRRPRLPAAGLGDGRAEDAPGLRRRLGDPRRATATAPKSARGRELVSRSKSAGCASTPSGSTSNNCPVGYTAVPYPVGGNGNVFHAEPRDELLSRGDAMQRSRIAVLAVLAASLGPRAPRAPPRPPAYVVNDSHFHLTNYVQEGTDIHDFLKIMGDKVGRVALFGIPLQQTWSYGNTGDFAPTYYLQTDAPLYYYSFTDAYIAMAYRSLTPAEQARFDPMITGFNPADMYAADHIRRVLTTFPGVFSGIGEFTIHKEFVSAKIAGETASLTDPALDRILDFAGEVGLVVLLHNDIDMPFPKPGQEPYQLAQLARLFKRHPKTTIIWAHCGLGRIVRPVEGPARDRSSARSTNPELDARLHRHLLGRGREVHRRHARRRSQRAAELINRHPDRFLFGTDEVAPDRAGEVPEGLRPVRAALRAADARGEREGAQGQLRAALRRGRRKVRAWEKANVTVDDREDVAMETHDRRSVPLGRARVSVAAALRCARPPGARRLRRPRPPAASGREADRRIDIYGFAMLDMGYDFEPERPGLVRRHAADQAPRSRTSSARTATSTRACARAGSASKGYIPTDSARSRRTSSSSCSAPASTPDRRRSACGTPGASWAQFGAGQTWSPFMDPDVFPNSVEYWGPNGMVVLPQRPGALDADAGGTTRSSIALERPGASADQGGLRRSHRARRTSAARFPLPDLSAHYRDDGDWGHVQVAGILRYIEWDDTSATTVRSSRRRHRLGHQPQRERQVHARRRRSALPVVYGEGIQNYMNDAPVDIGIENNFGESRHADRRQGAADPRHRRVLRPQLERPVDRAPSATRCVDIDNSDAAGAGRLQDGPVRARSTSSTTRSRT